ncbi:glutathione S-transferase [Tricladium varicosporioides]|nr:glutathione S-transferase [Hymenoscyphus varicosporioides]
MAQIKFYYAPGAVSLASHIILREIDAHFEAIANTVEADRVSFTPNFHQINPKMRVPVLILDGETITETPAILTAISSLAPNMNLLGTTNMERFKAYEWMNWLSGTLQDRGIGCLIRPERFSDDTAAWEGIRNKGLETIKKCFGEIEERLKGVHAVGDNYTAVDPYLFVFYRWGNDMGLKMENYVKYTALVKNVVERFAVKVALEFENIGTTLCRS